MSSSSEKIIIVSVYRHPKPNDHSFLNYSKETNKKKQKRKIILTCDFNVNLLKFEKNKEVEELTQFLTAPQILAPTRIPQYEKPSLIDNAFINFQDLICTSGNFTESVTDQIPNFFIIENVNFKIKIKKG